MTSHAHHTVNINRPSRMNPQQVVNLMMEKTPAVETLLFFISKVNVQYPNNNKFKDDVYYVK